MKTLLPSFCLIVGFAGLAGGQEPGERSKTVTVALETVTVFDRSPGA